MKAKSKKFNGAVMVFTLLLLFAGTAFANNGKYAQMMLENILENDPVLLGLFLLDVLLIAVRVRKVFRSLIIAFFAACLILVVGPFFLAKTGLVNSTALYVYAGAVFILLCRRKSKKQQQQTDTQDQNQHQGQPSANQQQTQSVTNEQTTTPPQPNKPKKSKALVFVVLIIVLGTALQGFQKFAKHLEAQARFEASLPKDEAARKRVEQAKNLIKRAENGDDDAQLRLAISLMEMVMKTNAPVSSLNEDLVQALSFLQKSYKQGNVEAQFLIAFSYFMQRERKEECFKLMKPIAEKDPAAIKKVYGIADKDGGKLYSSPEEMVALAQFVIAANYHDGAGTAKNLEQAEYWLKKSLEHGSEFVKETAPQLLESLRTEKTGKAQTHTTKTQPKPVQSKSVQSLSEPNDFDEAKGNVSKFLVSVRDIAEKLMKTEAYKTFQDSEINGDETLYMRSWYNDRYFMFCYDDTRQRPTANPVATFRTYSPEFTFAGGIKVGSYLPDPDFFGDLSEWNAEDNTLTVSEGNDEANIHITNDKIDYIEYNNLFAEYTHKMSNLLCLYRGDIYSAGITANGRLNVRDTNGTHGNILFQVTKQNNILLVDTSPERDSSGNRWYRVRFVYDKSTNTMSSVNEGYVMGKYINVEPLGYRDREYFITGWFNR